MKTKSWFPFVLLSWLIAGLCVSSSVLAQQQEIDGKTETANDPRRSITTTRKTSLSAEEQQWLSHHTADIRVGVTEIPPQVMLVDGQYKGLAIDYMQAIEQKLNCRFKLSPYPTWKDVIQAAKNREIDMIFAAQQTPERTEYLLFSKPYIELPNIILIRKDRQGGADLREMNGWTVTVSEGSAVHEFLMKQYPSLVLFPVPNELAGLEKVSLGEVDAMVVEISRSSYFIEKNKILNLRVSGRTELVYQLRFATRNDMPILCGILDKGLSLITNEEKLTIDRKWVYIGQQSFFSNKAFWLPFVIGIAVIIAFAVSVVIWNRTLRERVAKRTFELDKELTERKKAEEALRESELRLRIVADNTYDWEFWINPDGKINYISPSCERITGRRADEFYSNPNLITEIIHPDDRTIYKIHEQNSLTETDEGYLEFRVIRPDGELRWIEHVCQAVFDDAERFLGRRGSNRDCTEKKQAENILRKSEERYRILVETANEGIWTMDADHRSTFVNHAMADMLGYAPGEIIGKRVEEFFFFEDISFHQERMKKRHAGENEVYERRFKHRDGSELWTLVSAKSLMDNQGHFTGSFAMFSNITERKQAEETLSEKSRQLQETVSDLKRAQNMLQLVIESIPVRVFWKDRDFRFLGCNSLFAHDAGFNEPDELLGKDDYTMKWADQADLYRADDISILESGTPKMNIIEPQTTPSGSKLWLNTCKVPLRSPNDEIFGVLGVYEDITDRKLADDRLKKSERRFRSILDQAADIIMVHDLHGQFLDVNQQACHKLGYLKEEMLAMNVSDIDPESMASGRAKLWDVIATGKRFTFESHIKRRDGIVFPVEVNIGPIEVEEEILVLGIVRDITERKQAEQELRDSEARFKALHNASFGGIAIHDNGIILECNQGLSEITGYSAAELIGMDGVLLLAEQSRNTVRKNILNRYEKPYEVIGLRKDGSEYPVRLEGRNIPYKGKSVRTVEFRDISESKCAEEDKKTLQNQLTQAQKMESVGRLAGGIAHDFNNKLGIILGNAELILDELEPNHPIFSGLREIQQAAKQSADLTRQLLAFARKQTIFPKVLDLNETVEGILKMLRRLVGEDIDLAWLPGSKVSPVMMDSSQLDQILANLCVNARDAIEDVGKVTIETGNVAFDEAYCEGHSGFVPGDYVLLAVSDDGCGMSQEILKNIFEPFFTTKEVGKGTGLGLATVYGIVKQNNGFINVYSEPGQGTTFKIYLPLIDDKSKQLSEKHPEGKALRGRETILLVEDDPSILKMTTIMLEKLGYHVLGANTPDEAIQLTRKSSGEIDLLMTDVVMPKMNGRDLAMNLLSLYPNLKCLFTSGYTANVIAHHGVLDKGLNFIEKPFSMQDLAAMIRKSLSGTVEKSQYI
jgi:two-component system, cell cycle sensor histidine kinase and response regulator CckA